MKITFEIEALPEGGVVAYVMAGEGTTLDQPPILGMTIGSVGRKIADRIKTLWEKRDAESQ